MADEAIDVSVPAEPIADAQQAETPQAESSEPISYSGTKHKVKIDEQEHEVSYDDLIRGFQKEKAAKQAQAIARILKEGDTKAIAQLLGQDRFRKVSEEYLTDIINYEELPEDQKKIRDLETKNKEYEKKLQEQETQRQTFERQKLEVQASKQIEADMVKAVEGSGLKAYPMLFKRMAEVMEAYYDQNKSMLPAADALKYVRNDLVSEFSAHIEGLQGDDLATFSKGLPKKILDDIRKGDIEKVLSQSSLSKGRASTDDLPQPKKSKASDRRMSTDDWFSKMEKRLGG
jgi:hypothetical protein